MYKPDDNNIDRISRDAAEHYQAPGRPSWDALQQVLDKELPQEKERKRRGFLFFFLLALGLSVAGAGTWYLLPRSSVAPNLAQQANTKSKSANLTAEPLVQKSSPATAHDNNAPTDLTVDAGHSTVTAGEQQPTLPAKNVITASNEKKRAADASSAGGHTVGQRSGLLVDIKNKEIIAGKAALTVTNSRYKNGSAIFDNKGGSPLRQLAHEKETPGNSASPNNKLNTSKATSSRKKNNNTLATPRSTPLTDDEKIDEGKDASDNAIGTVAETEATSKPDAATTKITADSNVSVAPSALAIPAADSSQAASAGVNKKLPKKKSTTLNRAINIGLTAGIDVSTVKFTHGDNAGYNFGIMGGYQFSSHWSVYTGLIYTKKNYTLNGEDYHPPTHYWTQYVQLETVEGYCRMWELPLQARYTFNPSARTPFFASAGLSSYFMKKQGYTYNYKTMNMPYSTAWTNDSSFNHVFSILHLSAGIEKKIGRHMNWQIEPYAKIPLGGVGFGNIRLSSFGVNFTVQYRQPVKR